LKAIHRNGRQAFVWRRQSSAVTRVPVRLGTRNDSDWEIVAGVAEGDEIIVGTPPAAEETP
jgi:multidrug efflux pump subunit AcrA (membrane-fusion protein)